ncbi:MAG: DUF3488 and transglutaminase-like domain-containing protein [Pseudomonadota bacterium]
MKWLSKFKFSLPPLPTPPPVHAPDRATLLQMSAILLVAVVAHFYIASPIIAVYAAIIWLIKTVAVFRRAPNPPRLLVLLLTIFSFVMVLILYGGWNGQKAGISFLVLLVCLKFMESHTLRDYYVVCLLLFFVASSSFLFNSSLPSILMVVAYTVAITSLLLRISNPTHSGSWQTLRSGGLIMLKALPLAILLFFFFPRIQGNFGFIPSQDDLSMDNRLSNSLVAGDMANRAFDNALAFRVEFDGETPPNSQLYWRAKVMGIERNFHWETSTPSAEQLRDARERPAPINDENYASLQTYSYQIIHEDSSDFYVPFLDYALRQSVGVQLHDHSVYTPQPNEGTFTYEAVSSASPTIKTLAPENRAQLLQTASVPTARVQALLNQWRRETSTETELAARVFQHFQQSEYRYSLLPPSLGVSALDEFLFESKVGYCEHYASSYTILMRWLGIPSRVVVGYQGGEKNEIGNYIEVRYSDAHAWSEVWIDGQWERVDPTAAITPDRIDLGMEALLSFWDGEPLSGSATGRALSSFLNPTGVEKLYRQVRDTWRNVGYQWNKWVVNYDFDSQRELLSSLGFEHRNSLYTLVGIVIAGTLILMLFYFWQLIPKAIKVGEAQRLYLEFVNKFKKQKLAKAPADTPNEFAKRAIAQFPQHAEDIRGITDAYVSLRYGRTPGSLELFKQQVKRFKLSA